MAVIGQMIEEGALIQADTVEELAPKMGVDAATLKETFERTTRDAASGVDTLFEKEFLYPLDHAAVLRYPPRSCDAAQHV